MRTALASLAVATLTGAAAFVAAAPAWAHSAIVASTPAEGEVLSELPEAFSVTANETLLDLGGQGVFRLQIRDAAGRFYGDGCVSVVDATMSAEPAIGASGEYAMLFQIVSADGHPVGGEIPFSWVAPDGFQPAEAHDQPAECGVDPHASPTATAPAPNDVSPWVLPLTVVAALAALLAAIRAARIQQKARAASQPAPPEAPEDR